MKNTDLRQSIRNEVASIVALDALETAHIEDILQWIDSGADIFRIAKPDTPPKHLVSYFVVIDQAKRSLLLGDHIKAQLWLPTGGHVRVNEHPKQAVIREMKEELFRGTTFLRGNDKPFFVTVTETVGLTPGHTDVSLWYLVKGGEHEALQFERSEFTDMNWFRFDEILASHPAIFDPQMQRFTKKLVNYLS